VYICTNSNLFVHMSKDTCEFICMFAYACAVVYMSNRQYTQNLVSRLSRLFIGVHVFPYVWVRVRSVCVRVCVCVLVFDWSVKMRLRLLIGHVFALCTRGHVHMYGYVCGCVP